MSTFADQAVPVPPVVPTMHSIVATESLKLALKLTRFSGADE